MVKISTIRVTDRTKQRLRAIEHSPSETYESIILRLLETKVGDETIEYLIYDKNCKNCWIKIVIDWGNPNNSIQYLTREGNVVNNIPIYSYEDVNEQKKWNEFRLEVGDLANIRSMCSILEQGQTLHLGNIGIKRV